MRLLKLAVIATGVALSGFSSAAFGQEGVQKNFGQWRVECNPKIKENPCVLAFALVHPKDKKVAFAWSIVPDKEAGKQKTVVRTLNGTRLADGITVKFAKGEPLKLAYFTCGPRFCFAEFPFSESWLKTFKAQKGFQVSYIAVDGKPINHEVSLDQFSQAFEFYTANLAKTN